MTEERDPTSQPESDPLAREEAEAAAAEAGNIGGVAGDEDLDPAERPVAEGGGGVAEGFEQSEQALIDTAEHGDRGGDPTEDAGAPEAESDRSTAEYGEGDDADSTD